MKFLRVFAEDLLSYQTLDLPLCDQGLVLVEGTNLDLGGSNGSGKSSIFEIILWTLFGVTTRGLRGDAVIREDNQHSPIIGKSRGVVEFTTEDKSVQIFRHRKHKKYENKLIVVVNGVDVSLGGNPETQQLVNELVHLDAEAFTHAILFPQGQNSFAGLTDATQKSILDSILGTQRFDTARERTLTQLNKVLRSVSGAESMLGKIRGQIATVTDMQAKSTAARDLWESDRTRRITELNQQLQQLVKPKLSRPGAFEQKMDIDRWLADHDQYFAAIRDQLRTKDVELQNLVRHQGQREGLLLAATRKPKPAEPGQPKPEKSCGEYDRELSQLNSMYAAAEAAHHAASAEIRKRQAAIQRRESTTACSQCGQELTAEAKDRLFGTLSSDITSLEAARDEADRERQSLAAQMSELRTVREIAWQWAEYERELQSWVDPEEIRASIARHAEQLSLLQNEKAQQVEQLNTHAQALQTKAALEAELTAFSVANARYESERHRLENEITEKALEKNPHNVTIEQCEVSKQSLLKAQSFQSALRDRLFEEVDVLQFWLEGFGNKGVKSLLLDHAVPMLQDNANLYLDCLSNGTAHLSVSTVSTIASGETRDKLNVSASFRNGGGSYDKNSGGERRRVDLALLFALGDLGASKSRSGIQLRLLDEPFDDLDSIGSEQVVDLLNTYIVPKAGTVLVMSHNENLKALIPKRITVVKERGVSRIEQ